MAAVFGIHIGNSSACLAYFKDGNIDIIANDAGDRITPAVLAFHGTEKIVGLAAKADIARNGTSTVTNNKKLMNVDIKEDEFEDIVKKTVCKIIKDDNSLKYELKRGDKMCTLTPESVSTCLYSKLFAIASSSVRAECDLKTVLCVPLYFSQSSRQSIMRAAEEAGFEVLQVISEPAAAVLAHGIGIQDPGDENSCLVYRLGGVTLDVTVIQVSAGMYTVCSTVYEPTLGGDHFTNILAEYLAGEFKQKWKLDPMESRRSMVKLRGAAETCKHVLSTMSTAHCFVESLCDGVDFSYNISRARFENLIASVIQDYVQPIKDALSRGSLGSKSITKVILCGGSVKIPKLQQTIGELFPCAELTGGLNPDEVIAIGAAKQGSYLSQSIDPDCEHLSMEVPAVSLPIYVKQAGEKDMKCIIPALTPVPVKRVYKYCLESHQSEVWFELYEKEFTSTEIIRFLGKVSLSDIKSPTQVSLEINLSSIGGLHAVLIDNNSQKRCGLKLDAPQV